MIDNTAGVFKDSVSPIEIRRSQDDQLGDFIEVADFNIDMGQRGRRDRANVRLITASLDCI